jgi:hypothetical protein
MPVVAQKKWPVVPINDDDDDVLGNQPPIVDQSSIGCDL